VSSVRKSCTFLSRTRKTKGGGREKLRLKKKRGREGLSQVKKERLKRMADKTPLTGRESQKTTARFQKKKG